MDYSYWDLALFLLNTYMVFLVVIAPASEIEYAVIVLSACSDSCVLLTVLIGDILIFVHTLMPCSYQSAMAAGLVNSYQSGLYDLYFVVGMTLLITWHYFSSIALLLILIGQLHSPVGLCKFFFQHRVFRFRIALCWFLSFVILWQHYWFLANIAVS